MKRNSKRSILFIILITVVVLVFALKDDVDQKIKYLFSFDLAYLLLACFLFVLYLVCRTISLHFFIKKFENNYKFGKTFKLMLETQFVNNITPFAAVGQPYQIYKFKKQNIDVSKGTNIVIEDFIVYQMALIILGSVAILINYFLHFFENDLFLKKLVIIGYIINLLVIVFLFFLSFNKKSNTFILDKIIKIGTSLKIIKRKEEYLNKKYEYIDNFHKGALKLFKDKGYFILMILINILGLILLYLIPFALITGLGYSITPLSALVATSYVMIVSAFIPTPGASGGIEFCFTVFFGTFITGPVLSSIMIAWRFITYYMGFIIGAFAIVKEDKI